jgi:hypothetical protein
MRAFKTRPFARFAAKEGIADVVLRDAIGRDKELQLAIKNGTIMEIEEHG